MLVARVFVKCRFGFDEQGTFESHPILLPQFYSSVCSLNYHLVCFPSYLTCFVEDAFAALHLYNHSSRNTGMQTTARNLLPRKSFACFVSWRIIMILFLERRNPFFPLAFYLI